MTLHFRELDKARNDFLGGGLWKLRKLTDVTVVFGRNGSGKSMLLRAIRDHNQLASHYVTPSRMPTRTTR